MEFLVSLVSPKNEFEEGYPNCKGKSKLSFLADNMTLYAENTKKSLKTLIEIMSSARLHDTESIYKNQLYFYALPMKNQKIKLR